jgi:hypothetical protein
LLCSCANETVKCLTAEYLPEEKLLDWNFIKTTQHKDIYRFQFKEDSLPYVASNDSLFVIDIENDLYILYYNCSLFRNTGFILYGTHKNTEVQVIQTGKILLCEVYLIERKPLLKIIETADADFGNPLTLKTHYLLFSLQTHALQGSVSALCYASFLQDTSKIELKDSISNTQISLYGVQNGKKVIYDIAIKGNDFIVSEQERICWNDMKVLEKDVVYGKTMHCQ